MRILIVDDDLVSREKLRKIMGGFGQCIVVENGKMLYESPHLTILPT